MTSYSLGEDASSSSSDYNAYTVTELKAICKERGIAGYSSLTKAELVALLKGSEM